MKKLFTLLICATGLLNASAQTSAGKSISEKGLSATKSQRYETIGATNPIVPIVKGGKNPGGSFFLSVGGGFTSPGKAMKNNTYMGNLTNYNIGAYLPVLNYSGATGEVVSIGFNLGGEYFSGNRDYNISNFPAYNISVQTSSPTVVAKGAGSPRNAGFKTEGGAQASFSFGKITISPVLNAAYIDIKQKSFSVTQTISANGQTKEFNLYSQAETKTSGFAFIPKLRLSYFPGKVGFYVEGNYTIGPTSTNQTKRFKPSGSANEEGNYNIDQILLGTDPAQTTSTKLNAFGVNVGVSMAFSRIGRIVRGGGKNSTLVNPLYQEDGRTGTNPMAEIRRSETLKSNKNSELSRPYGGNTHWGRHTNVINQCVRGGIYCFTRKFMDNADIKAFIPSQDDEVLTESSINLKNNLIVLKSIGIKGQLSAGTLKAFKDKKVELMDNYLSLEILEPLFKAIKLNAPKEGIFIKPEEQSYSVNETQLEGKKVSIVEVTEKTNISIGGKTYILLIISTSGKGSGSPKDQGF